MKRRPLLALGLTTWLMACAALPARAADGSVPPGSATINGVSFERAARVADQPLVLNGTGARSLRIFTAYVAALYLPQPAHTVDAVTALPGAKRLQIRMVTSFDVPMAEFAKAFRLGVERNLPAEAQQRLAERVARFDALLVSQGKARKGDDIKLDCVPGDGLQFWMNGKQVGAAIPGDDFCGALMHVFLGAHVSDDRLRDGLLARAS